MRAAARTADGKQTRAIPAIAMGLCEPSRRGWSRRSSTEAAGAARRIVRDNHRAPSASTLRPRAEPPGEHRKIPALQLLGHRVWDSYPAILDACWNARGASDGQIRAHRLDWNQRLGRGQNFAAVAMKPENGATERSRQHRTRYLLRPLRRAGALGIQRPARRCHRLWSAGASRRWSGLANARPTWQSQPLNRVIGWIPV